jgi:hypothetical protein
MISERSKPKIEGIIIPSSWDEIGNIKGVSLHTPDEKEYRVEHGGVGRELLAHVHHRIKAAGKIRERIDGRLYISVRSYLAIEEPQEEEEERIK